MDFSNTLKKYAEEYSLDISDELAEKLAIYSRSLVEWNEKINLTAITDEDQMIKKHFIDSLLVTKAVDFKENASLIDIGTGAGFPGLVIAAAREDLRVTLLDSTGKKLAAVEDIAGRMGVRNVTFLHARAEEAGQKAEYREKFDYATARAVAALHVLAEYSLPFVKVGGTFVSMKGASAKEEITQAEKAIAVLGGKIEGIKELTLFDCGERAMINVKKISQIPTKYPRPSAQIAKKPL